MTSDDLCARCGHERWHHLGFRGEPRACAAKEVGQQCQAFVEPTPDFHLRRADELALLVETMLSHECAQFPSTGIIRRALAAGVAIPKHLERYLT